MEGQPKVPAAGDKLGGHPATPCCRVAGTPDNRFLLPQVSCILAVFLLSFRTLIFWVSIVFLILRVQSLIVEGFQKSVKVSHTVHSPASFRQAGVRDCPVYGRFPGADVVGLEWRTEPLKDQIPIRWLARVCHWSSSQKFFARRKDLPASRDMYHSTVYITVSYDVFLQFRSPIQRWFPGTSKMWRRSPRRRLWRWLLKPFMKGTRHLECGFGADLENSGRNLLVRPIQHPRGELQRSCNITAPYSSLQMVFQEWAGKDYSANPMKKANCNQFARECLLWGEEQPMVKLH